MYGLNIGDRIIVRTSMYSKTPKWMDGYRDMIIKLNKKSVTVQLDEYPKETHRDLRKI